MNRWPYLFSGGQRASAVLVIVSCRRLAVIPQQLALRGFDRRANGRGWSDEVEVLTMRVVTEIESLVAMPGPEARRIGAHNHCHGLEALRIGKSSALAFESRGNVGFERHGSE